MRAIIAILQLLSRDERGQLYAGRAAMDTVQTLRKKGAKMTNQDKVVVKATLVSCSTGTEAKEGVLGRQADLFGYNGKKGKRKFKEFVGAKLEIDATDNRTLQTKVQRRTRADKLDGNPIFDTIFEANTDQVKGKRGTKRKYVGCEIRVLNGKRRRRGLYEEHAAGIRSMSLEEMRVGAEALCRDRREPRQVSCPEKHDRPLLSSLQPRVANLRLLCREPLEE